MQWNTVTASFENKRTDREGMDIWIIWGRIFKEKSGADLRYQKLGHGTEHEEMREQNTQWSEEQSAATE